MTNSRECNMGAKVETLYPCLTPNRSLTTPDSVGCMMIYAMAQISTVHQSIVQLLLIKTSISTNKLGLYYPLASECAFQQLVRRQTRRFVRPASSGPSHEVLSVSSLVRIEWLCFQLEHYPRRFTIKLRPRCSGKACRQFYKYTL